MAPSRVNSRHFAHFTPYKTPFEGMKEATDSRERSRDKSCVLFTGSRHNKAPISGALIMLGADANTTLADREGHGWPRAIQGLVPRAVRWLQTQQSPDIRGSDYVWCGRRVRINILK